MTYQDFHEIGHSGGKVTFKVRTDQNGRASYQVEWSHSRGGPAAVFAVYALPQGIAVGDIEILGMGVPWNPPPLPNCFPVFIASDSEGMFGRQCGHCDGYWRAKHLGKICPYCGVEAGQSYQLLTDAQRRYVQQYCKTLMDGLQGERDEDHTIDMDAVADAVGQEEKPDFYYSEERQQNLFTCDACGAVTDVLGMYAYCSLCGTRNDLSELRKKLSHIRDVLKVGSSNETAVKEAVAAFDSFATQISSHLLRRVPMILARRNRLEKTRFHNLAPTVEAFRDFFGIIILNGLSADDAAFLTLQFHRRHVYEHKGGEADKKYIADSGDTVRPKQRLRETPESAHRTINLVGQIAANLSQGFHDIFPPLPEPIENFCRRQQPST